MSSKSVKSPRTAGKSPTSMDKKSATSKPASPRSAGCRCANGCVCSKSPRSANQSPRSAGCGEYLYSTTDEAFGLPRSAGDRGSGGHGGGGHGGGGGGSHGGYHGGGYHGGGHYGPRGERGVYRAGRGWGYYNNAGLWIPLLAASTIAASTLPYRYPPYPPYAYSPYPVYPSYVLGHERKPRPAGWWEDMQKKGKSKKEEEPRKGEGDIGYGKSSPRKAGTNE